MNYKRNKCTRIARDETKQSESVACNKNRVAKSGRTKCNWGGRVVQWCLWFFLFFFGCFSFFGFCLFWLATQCWHVPNAILTGFARTHLHKVTEKRRQQQQQQQQHGSKRKKSTPVRGVIPPVACALLPCVRGWHNLRLKGLNLSCCLSPMSALIFHLRRLPSLPPSLSLSL